MPAVMRAALLSTVVALAACAAAPRTPPPPPLPAGPMLGPPAPDPAALVREARALRAAGSFDDARGWLAAALAAAPSDALRLELADLVLADGQAPERAAALLADVRDRGGDVRYDLDIAQLAELRGDDGAASDAYRRALATCDDADVRTRRALALGRLGRRAEAIEELERVRVLRPDEPSVHERLAELYEADARIGDAERAWTEAAEAAPERPAAWSRLARFYERVGKTDAARRADARARELSGRTERALRALPKSRR
jgi:tetratricopeptide (TPR) repeat protein